jgi:hypothetical protein
MRMFCELSDGVPVMRDGVPLERDGVPVELFNSKLLISFLTCAKYKGFLMLPLPKF